MTEAVAARENEDEGIECGPSKSATKVSWRNATRNAAAFSQRADSRLSVAETGQPLSRYVTANPQGHTTCPRSRVPFM